MATTSATGAGVAETKSANTSQNEVKGIVMEKTATGEEQAKISTPFGEHMATKVEEKLYAKMLTPMMNDMEKSVAGSSKILDRINLQMERDRDERVKQNRSSHIPEALKGGGQKPDAVLKKVEQLIFFAEVEGEVGMHLQEHVRLQELAPEGMTSVIASSLKAYLSTLLEPEMKKVVTKINADCQLWLSRLFRFEDASVFYHDDEREGLVRICRLALYLRYPKYATDGFDALYSRPPVIYMSAAASAGLGQYLCLQLGLPVSCICTVPCNTVFGASSKMDVAMLEKLIQDDIAAAKTPLLLLAYAGTPVVGHVDNVQRLQEICQVNNIWLHLEGNYLATLALFSNPSQMLATASGNSITVSPSSWLGVPGLPSATLFKTSDATLMHAAGLNTFNTALKLNCLPYWMCLMILGHESIVSRVVHACDLAKSLYDKLEEISAIKQISREKKDITKNSDSKPLMETLSKAINPLLVFEMTSPTVVFRYKYESADAVASLGAVKQDEEPDYCDSVYFDALNIWLAEGLQTSDPKVAVETVDVENEGVCIRFSPLETAQATGTTLADIDQFVASLTSNLSVLNASSEKRKLFQNVVASQPNLVPIQLQNWAGLGAVSYTPDVYLSKEELTDEDFEAIVNLNSEILQQLQTKDTAFSMGETEMGYICVKFGLVTEDTDVEELVQLVQNVGREIEESSRFLDTMTEVIRKGIQQANRELQKENENKLLHEGVLRQIPMVSSMLNWWSPIKEEVKGRSFNLNSCKIASTQDTYKYRMQIKEEASPPSVGSKTTRTSSSSSASGAAERGIVGESKDGTIPSANIQSKDGISGQSTQAVSSIATS